MASHQNVNSICSAFVKCIMELFEFGVIVFLLPSCLELFDCWKSLPESGLLLCGKVLLDSVRVLWSALVVFATWQMYNGCVITAKISQTCFTLSQSLSLMANAAHSMCLIMWLLCQVVEMGPYQWSAEEIKRLMGWEETWKLAKKNERCRKRDFAKFVWSVEHKECGTPSDIAMQWYLDGSIWTLLNTSIHWAEAWICVVESEVVIKGKM